jgi:hypothetical protein
VNDDVLKWQPVVMILEGNQRLECECGALAVFISGKHPEDGKYNQLDDVDVWCQSCWTKAVQEEEKDEE